MRRFWLAILLLLLVTLPILGYVQTERERILRDHLKRVATMAEILLKNTPMSDTDRANFKYVVNELKQEAYQYEQAVQSGR